MAANTGKLTINRYRRVPYHLKQSGGAELHLPFEAVLSLEPLIGFWRSRSDAPGEACLRMLYPQIEEKLKEVPALAGPIADAAVLHAHQAFLDLLMMPVFAPAFRDSDLAAALVPFTSRAFYATPSFERLLTRENDTLAGQVNLDVRTYTYGKIISAYLHILRSVYGLDVPFEYPVTFSTKDPETGLDRHFKVHSDFRFVRIRQRGQAPPLSEETRQMLLSNAADLALWMELIPPQAFAFYGFDVVHAHDVTDDEVVSMLKYDLLEGDGFVSPTSYPGLIERMRTLLQKPGIELGLAAIEGGQLLLLSGPLQVTADGRLGGADYYDLADLGDSVFGRCLQSREVQVVGDLSAGEQPGALEREMHRAGVRSLLAAPLFFQGRAVGVLYLWSKAPGDLDSVNMLKLLEVLPLFATAARRGVEELRSRMQAAILEEYTSIHPSVEWRFRKAALHFIRKQDQGLPAEIEPIVFEGVYPLYAASDIRGSSTHRNEAVQADLLDHMGRAEKVLHLARKQKPLPLLDHLLARIARHRAALEGGLSSGDEVSVRDFLHSDLDPIFSHLRTFAPELQAAIEGYYQALDPEEGVLHRRSRDFEHSVALINRTISSYLDAEERKAQRMCPHYFEKHQTDGVDFSIYVGASLLEEGPFDPLYVKNLRLWQLMVMCGIARRMEPLKKVLPVPLETTHLILTQNMPIAIRFRFDETRFDVDGAHHIRYEIMKQRVEKAALKGRDERLTQPGKIAIVYAQSREALEYEEYIEFLQEMGHLTSEVERVELDDLQGMKGLKALRVKVALSEDGQSRDIAPEVIQRAVRDMPSN